MKHGDVRLFDYFFASAPPSLVSLSDFKISNESWSRVLLITDFTLLATDCCKFLNDDQFSKYFKVITVHPRLHMYPNFYV